MNGLPPPGKSHWRARLLSGSGSAGAFTWGLAEGSFFFLVPDLLITLTALYCAKRSLVQMIWVVAGSLVAGTGLFLWSAQDPVSAKEAVAGVPFVREWMWAETEQEFAARGAAGLLTGPMKGTPYKVYAVLAPAHLSMPVFLLASIPARFERLLISWAVFAAVGWGLRKRRIQDRTRIAFHVVYWVGIYAYYWSFI